MTKISDEEKELLDELIKNKNISKHLIYELVEKAIEIRYQNKAIGFKDDISDLIKEFANDKRGS